MRYLLFVGLVFLIKVDAVVSSKALSVQPCSAAFVVSDLDESTVWYEALGFKQDTLIESSEYGVRINFLKMGYFTLELIDFEDAALVEKEHLPSEYSNVHGFVKLGFLAKNLDSVIAKLGQDSHYVVGPANLPLLESENPWPHKFYLIKDPDGNYMQFFQGDNEFNEQYGFLGELSIAPFLAMLSVGNFDDALDWYKQIGFKEYERLEDPGNQRALLKSGTFFMEIGSFEHDISLAELSQGELDRDRVVRMAKLGFMVAELDTLYQSLKNSGSTFLHSSLRSKNPNFIVRDMEQNNIQFFEN